MSSPLPVSAFAVRPRQMRLVQLAPHLTAAVLPARACLALRGEVQIAVAWGAADADGAVLGADWQRVVRPGSGGVACTVWPVKHQGAHGKRPTVRLEAFEPEDGEEMKARGKQEKKQERETISLSVTILSFSISATVSVSVSVSMHVPVSVLSLLFLFASFSMSLSCLFQHIILFSLLSLLSRFF